MESRSRPESAKFSRNANPGTTAGCEFISQIQVFGPARFRKFAADRGAGPFDPEQWPDGASEQPGPVEHVLSKNQREGGREQHVLHAAKNTGACGGVDREKGSAECQEQSYAAHQQGAREFAFA